MTDTLDLKTVLNSSDVSQHLILGFYGGSDTLGVGSVDVGAVAVSVTENGTQVFTKSFANGSAAHTYFAGSSAVDLGLLGTGGTGLAVGSVLDVGISLTTSTTAAGSLFDGRMLIST